MCVLFCGCMNGNGFYRGAGACEDPSCVQTSVILGVGKVHGHLVEPHQRSRFQFNTNTNDSLGQAWVTLQPLQYCSHMCMHVKSTFNCIQN